MRRYDALREELQGYLKKQDKFTGAMKHILVEHKEKIREERRVQRGANFKTFTPPNKDAPTDFFVSNTKGD